MAGICDEFDRQVRPLIDVIDSLRSAGLSEDISLPSVVVIGDQSSGKSSVLEAICGIQLPRGTGIVTRCALELRMKKLKADQDNEQDDGAAWKARLTFKRRGENDVVERSLHRPEEVHVAVEEAQNEAAGNGRNICTDQTLLLEVEAVDVPNLTLIDLPGIARIAGEGQAENIEEQIKTLINHYIKNEDTIILCVIPSNVDIATTEALKMAKEVDPDGLRTVGVLTKPDLVDRGTERSIVEIARNKSSFKLKLGFTLVKCRSQMNIDGDMSLKEALEEEKRFFRFNEHFSLLASEGKAGIDNLSRKLTRQLVTQIQKQLPRLKKSVADLRRETDEDLRDLGNPPPENQAQHLIKALDVYGSDVKNAGAGFYNSSLSKEDKLYAIIHLHSSEFMAATEKLQPGPAEEADECLQIIQQRLREGRGRELPTFPSFEVFRQLSIEAVLKMLPAAKALVGEVYECVYQTSFRLAEQHFGQFPPLKERIQTKVDSYLSEQRDKALDDIEITFEKEQWVYTQDPNFVGLLRQALLVAGADPSQAKNLPEGQVMSTSMFDTELTRLVRAEKPTDIFRHDEDAKAILMKLEQYFKIVRARLSDSIPKTVYYRLVTCFSKNLGSRLISEIVIKPPEDDDDWIPPEKLVVESPDIEDRRQRLQDKVQRLKKGEWILQRYGR
ncbi:interferon-induced GTP-binding protein Mx2-like [Oscarella lobularis]|uniref:interferon-induced GTP-binding protein Mx2-like n=1 Tax=Oscarella lobularis TaxID=121494 RepID=UPI00331435F0